MKQEIFYLLFGIDVKTNFNELLEVSNSLEEIEKWKSSININNYTGLVIVRSSYQKALQLITLYTSKEAKL